jgi:O-succinylbenzoic acid--CoA ligase
VGVLTPPPGVLQLLEVPPGPDLVGRVLPEVADALAGGCARLPVPAGGGGRTDRLAQVLRAGEPVVPGAALVVPTSGSTGEPKGVVLPAATLTAAASVQHERLGGPGSWLLALPATHVAGLMVLVRSVVAGTTPVVLDLAEGFDPDAFAAATVRLFARTTGRRYTALVPTQLRRILDAETAVHDAARAYHAILLGGGPAPEPLLQRAAEAGIPVVTTYGMTETCGGCAYDGRALPGVTLAVDEEDRIVVRGPVVAAAYRTPAADEPIPDQTFRTSDLGRLDDGLLTVLGRVDDVVVSGAVNVPLPAVERILAEHPALADAACTGADDPEWGRRVVAVVVPRDPHAAPTLDALRAFVTERAPGPYAPRQLVVVDALPTLPTGKVDRLALERLAEQVGALRAG